MNPMSQALKQRRSGQVPPKEEMSTQGMPQQEGAVASPGGDLEKLVAMLDPESKAKLMTLLQTSEAPEGQESQPSDNDQSAVTEDETAELAAEVPDDAALDAQNIFRGQAGALGESEDHIGKPKNLMDRFKGSMGKHFKK